MKPPDRIIPPGRHHKAPPFPDTPELAEQRAQSPTAQAMIRATRRLLAEGGLTAAADRRIHAAGEWPVGTMRYWFGGREGLLVQVARHEHLRRLDQIRRALRAVASPGELTETLLGLADAQDHYRVARALLDAAAAMPDLAMCQHRLWEEWRTRMREIVVDLQERGIVRAELDPEALALLWSAVTSGLAEHREAPPTVDLRAVIHLLHRYAANVE